MSNYTIELRFLENEPISKIFDFNYTYYMKGLVSDEIYEKVFVYEKRFDEYFESIVRFRQLCEMQIGDGNVKICIENTGGFTDFEKKAMDYLLESHVFCLTWDVGHSISSNEKDMEYILAHVSKLAHFHIHDGTRTEHCH